MRILVLGASQGTGALCVKEALKRGHQATAFARTPEKLGFTDEKLTLFQGDFHDAASVHAAVAGHDAVIITASATRLSGFKTNPHYFSQGTGYAIAAMKRHGVSRLVVLSALGASESKRLLSLPMRLFIVDFILKRPFADHGVQEHQARTSGLDWVIARPSRLTNGPATGLFEATEAMKKVPGSISRADVASFLVEACETRKWVGAAVHLGG